MNTPAEAGALEEWLRLDADDAERISDTHTALASLPIFAKRMRQAADAIAAAEERAERAEEEYARALSIIRADELGDFAEQNSRLREALERAAKVFDCYAMIHEAKGTSAGNLKAATNRRHAADCRRVLTTPEAPDEH